MLDAGRFVGPFAAKRLGTQVGRVRFDQQAILRDKLCHLAQLITLFERDHAGETDVQAQLETLGGKLLVAGEASA